MIHPAGFKNLTNKQQIRRAALPKKVIIHLSQHIGKPAEPVVNVGDIVYPGTMIGKPKGFISSPVHSPLSGKVVAIEYYPHPVIRRSLCVVIESDGQDADSKLFRPRLKEGKESSLTKEQQLQLIQDCGVVGMGGGAFPAHVKLAVPEGRDIDTLIINGAECEPYLTCDHRLMLERANDILEGARIMMDILDAKECFIGIEANKSDAINVMRKALQGNPDIQIKRLKTKYPQGAEKQLIKSTLNRTVPSQKLPFKVGVVVHNVATAVAVYEAVALWKPLYERVITVSGGCIKNPSNILVKIGTPVSDLIEECGGLRKDPVKIVMGGPLMGQAIYNLDMPILKGTSGVLFLSKDELAHGEAGVCIRCGNCVISCPMNLVPTDIYAFSENRRFAEAKEHNLLDCMECGACAWACPSKLDLVGMFKLAKQKVR